MSSIDLSTQTFSNSWYRVYELRCALRPSVKASKQIFGGEVWIILRDAMSNEWFRVSPEAYAFLGRLKLEKTVEATWYTLVEEKPETSLSQEEIVQLLGQLHLANMLVYDQISDAESFFERFTTKKRKERLTTLMGFLSIKVPLLDPDRALNRALPFIKFLFSPFGVAAYFLLLALGLITAIEHHERLFESSQGILAPDNLLLLYLGFAIAKVIHELGHAALCKFYGGEVHILGLMFILFTPIPYCDASASWGFRQKYERLLVGAAGMICELAVASIALLIWASTAPGTINALCYNVVFAASVSTILFNANPLLRFDGYHMLVDLLNLPNLFANSRNQLKYLISRYILRIPLSAPSAQSFRESWILPVYGVVSLSYWLVLMIGIVTFVANQYLDLGMLMAMALVVMIAIIPLFKLVKYLALDDSLSRIRSRTLAICATIVLAILIPASLIPMPYHVRVNGIIEASVARKIFSPSNGYIVETSPRNGTALVTNQTLFFLDNPELDFQIQSASAKKRELLEQLQQALVQTRSNVLPIKEQLRAVEQHLNNLLQQQGDLHITTPIDGAWTGAQEANLHEGSFLPRGSYLGIVTQSASWRFVGVLKQVETFVFSSTIQEASIKVHGQEATTLQTDVPLIIPFDNGRLPSTALGMPGGGEIAVDPSDPQGLTAAEPFFRVEANIDPNDINNARLMHGAMATMLLTLPSEPLLTQFSRQIRQYMQTNFRI